MYYSEELIQRIREQNDIVDIIRPYVQLKRTGSNYVGLCPFHNEKSPSFSVSPQKQMYFCFGCHAGGNVFTFLQKYDNISFPEAVAVLAEKGGVELPQEDAGPEEKARRSKNARLYDINYAAGKYYYHLLRSEAGKLGQDYLEKRGVSPEVSQRFGLGYAGQKSGALVAYLRKEGFDDELIRDSGLGKFSEKYGMYDSFINRVIFPIMNGSGKIIAFGGRVLGDAKPKYLNSPETGIFEKRKNLYAFHMARSSRAKQFILCEGYMDVIAMHQAGFTQAMASLGTSFTPEQAMMLKRLDKDVYLAYDSDGAGTAAALRAISILRETGISAKVINMQPYKDPDEFIRGEGREEFEKRIEEAENAFMYEIRQLRKDYSLDDPDQKTKFFNATARKLLVFEEEMERENYLEAVAGQYSIPVDALRKRMIDEAKKGGFVRERTAVTESPAPSPGRRSEDHSKYAQRLLLTWLSEEQERYARIRDYICPGDFTDPLYEKVAEKMFSELEKGSFNPASALDMFEDPEEQRIASEVFHTRLDVPVEDGRKEEAFRDIVIRIKQEATDHAVMSGGAEALDKLVKDKKLLEQLRSMERL